MSLTPSTFLDHLKAQPSWIIFLSFLGFLSIFTASIQILNWVFRTFIRPPKDLIKTYGPWALVTGATDGIGKAFAVKLAEKGLNLVLVSRDSGKLAQVSGDIRGRYPHVHVKIFKLDFSTNDVVSRVDELRQEIHGLEIGVLVNNVGVTYPGAMYFHEVDEDVWMEVVRVNVVATTYVTMAVVPGMVKRKRGAIVNLGSGASVVVPSHPLYTIYAATKSYIDQLSRSLHVEYKHNGIHVQCQIPLYVSTKMSSRVAFVENTSLFTPSAQTYVDAAVKQIGYESRCAPYWPHSIQWFFASLLPRALLDSSRLSTALKRRRMSRSCKSLFS